MAYKEHTQPRDQPYHSLTTKQKKNCFIKQLIGHYLQKEISSSMAGPDLQALNLFPSVTAAFKLGTKIQQQQQ